MLFNYLRDWRTWVNRGAPDCDPYSRGDGLCLSTDDYVLRYVRSECRQDAHVDLRAKLENALENDFGENYRYPFGGKDKYKEEYQHETTYLNAERLAWVDKYLLETRKDYDLALLDFLKEWKDNAATGRTIVQSRGLCSLALLNGSTPLRDTLQEFLAADYGEAAYPFGMPYEEPKGGYHKNPKRRNWVDATIKKIAAKYNITL